jgi:hypothetical protein
MEGGEEAAGDGAKRKREATPDADCCCDICHEVCVRPRTHLQATTWNQWHPRAPSVKHPS